MSCWATAGDTAMGPPVPQRNHSVHLEDDFFQVLLPRQRLHEVVIELHLPLRAIDQQHPNVLEDEGDVLPLPQAVREVGRGAVIAVLHLPPGHGGLRGHPEVFEGLQLLVAWKKTHMRMETLTPWSF